MTIHKVINYESGKVHYAKATNEELAKILPAEMVTPERWWHWQTVCGKELIAHVLPDDREPVDCQSCLRGFERAKRAYADLVERFGAGQ